jgi:hypothetical protein
MEVSNPVRPARPQPGPSDRPLVCVLYQVLRHSARSQFIWLALAK